MSISCTASQIEQRVAQALPRITQLLARCSELEAEAGKLVRDRKDKHNLTRALFVEELIREAQDKLVEGQMVCDKLSTVTDESEARLATVERWATSAGDLISRAIRVLDDVEDVFGKRLPTGGLWDK